MMSATVAKLLEAAMLLIFGASWPAQICKTIRVKNPQGKSFMFLYLVMTGYLCGMASKFAGAGLDAFKNWVLYIYILDFAMVATDTIFSHYYMAKLKNG
jgi:hypothetical protein